LWVIWRSVVLVAATVDVVGKTAALTVPGAAKPFVPQLFEWISRSGRRSAKVVVSPTHGGGHPVLQRPHLCLINNPAGAAPRDGPCPLRVVITMGRVRPIQVVGFCAGCSPPRLANLDRADGSVLSIGPPNQLSAASAMGPGERK
jgi:hypothetical protein